MNPFDEQALKRSLSDLTANQRLAFGLILAKRHMRELSLFSTATGFDNSKYEMCVDSLSRCLNRTAESRDYEIIRYDGYLNDAPDTEDYDHPLTSYALNEALIINCITTFLSSDNSDHLVEAAILSMESSALKAEDTNERAPVSMSIEELLRHPKVLHDTDMISADLFSLRNCGFDSPSQLLALVEERALNN